MTQLIRRYRGALAVVTAGTALVVLYFFPPTQYAVYPRCVFHVLTGWDCPGCGSMRAAHAILHGDLSAAFHYNPLLFVLAPVIVGALLAYLVRKWNGRELFPYFRRPFWGWLLVVLVIGFGILRNL